MGVILDSEADDTQEDDIAVANVEPIEKLDGKMHSDLDEDRLMHSVIENDEQTIQDGKLLSDAVDYAIGSFTPDLMFKELVRNFRNAQRLYGPTIIRELSGFSSEYIEKNIKMAEFREDVKRNIEKNIQRLQQEGLLDGDGKVSEEGLRLAAIVTYAQELDHLETRGLGRKDTKERAHYGEHAEHVPYQHQRYKDLDIRASVLNAIRRGHDKIHKEDLRAYERVQHGKISIVYALDASGSMRGKKISMAKKAGIALAHRATNERNDVGIAIFTKEVHTSIPPTKEFALLLETLMRVRAGHETDLSVAIQHATEMFERGAHTKHLIIITDALPTTSAGGKDPLRVTLEAASAARDAGITISIIGINLEREGEKLAAELTSIGKGKLYRIQTVDELDTIILEDYESLK